jgi:hypothetical protein
VVDWSETKKSWIALAVTTTGGLLVLIIATLWLKFWEGVPFDQVLARSACVGVSGALILTLLVPKWRRLLWAQPWQWIRGIRVRTVDQLKDLENKGFDTGYAKRSSEVKHERKSARLPFWEIRQRDEHFYLYNHGNPVTDVHLTAQADSFVMYAGSGWWKEPESSGVGKQFHGHITDRGRSQGVTFAVRWLDPNGDEKWGTASLHQSQMQPFEGRAEAYERGRAAGRAEAIREASLDYAVGTQDGGLP